MNQMLDDLLNHAKSAREPVTKKRVDSRTIFEEIIEDISQASHFPKPLFIIKQLL